MAATTPPLIEATTTKDMVAVWRMLIDEAKGGNVRAAELILQRVLGRAVEPADTAAARALDVVEEIEVKRAYRAAMHKPPVVVDAVPVEDESPANGA